MKNSICCFIFILGLNACSNSDDLYLFTDNIVEIEKFQKESRLTGISLFDDAFGYFRIVCIDKYLILFSTQREHLFYVYSVNGDSLGCFGDRGKGPNDLINIRWCGQSSNTNMWINDVSNLKLQSINLKQSLLAKHCIFDKTIRNRNHSINSFICNDSLLITEQMTDDNFNLFKVNLHNTNDISMESLYNYPSMHPFSVYKSIWRIKPDGNKMVSAMQSINMVNLLDLANGTRASFVINPPVLRLRDAIDENTKLEKWTYYIDLNVSDKKIYALYCNQKYEESFEVEKEMEIHVFDWFGNPLCKYIVPQYITSMTVDENNSCIYGLASDEKVYLYKLETDILKVNGQ